MKVTCCASDPPSIRAAMLADGLPHRPRLSYYCCRFRLGRSTVGRTSDACNQILGQYLVGDRRNRPRRHAIRIDTIMTASTAAPRCRLRRRDNRDVRRALRKPPLPLLRYRGTFEDARHPKRWACASSSWSEVPAIATLGKAAPSPSEKQG